MAPSNWTVLNNLQPDNCAEHDNIHIVFRGAVTNFSIISTHPVDYTCNPNFSNCVSGNDTNYYFDAQMWTLKYGTGNYGAWANIYRKSSFWRPQGMTFSYNGMFPETNIHEISFGREIVVHGGESPGRFVIYSDGYIRVIPFPPIGRPDVCFGSSVIIGPANISDRPYADMRTATATATMWYGKPME